MADKADTANEDKLVAELTEIARQFAEIEAHKKPKDDETPDDKWRDQKTRNKIEYWAEALKAIIYELREQRSASFEVTAMLTDLVGELANLYHGSPTPIRNLRRKTNASRRSIQRANNQALAAIIIDNMLEANAEMSLEAAARQVAQGMAENEVLILSERSHSETPKWEQLVDLRKKIRATASGKPVRDAYDMHTSTLHKWPPAERITRAWAAIRKFKVP